LWIFTRFKYLHIRKNFYKTLIQQRFSCNYCFPISWVTGCVVVGCHVPIQSVSINNLSKIISLTCSPLLTCHIVGDLKKPSHRGRSEETTWRLKICLIKLHCIEKLLWLCQKLENLFYWLFFFFFGNLSTNFIEFVFI
jgi:hypothetical protein